MGLNNFIIQFEKPLKVYFSGEVVTGRVVVDLSSEKTFRKIKLELVGRGSVHWTETRTVSRTDSNGNSQSETVTDHYSNEEKYFNQEVVIHHGPSLPPGVHILPFSLMLPPNLPSSFEGHHGNVRYYVKADIVRDWKWNHKVKQHIMVNGILDLNLFPSALTPGNSTDHKKLCCLCCKSGPITAAIHSNRTGYVPGEMIGFNAEVDNLSNRDMSGSFLNLVEVVTYRATRKSRTERRVVAEIRRGLIRPGTSDYWEGVVMKVPPLPPSGLAGSCTIIDVQYSLEFHVDPSGPAFDLVVRIPVIVGTIPLLQYIPTFAPPPSYESGEFGGGFSVPSAPSAPALDQFKMYPDLPPPTYNESVWGPANVRHSEDDEHTKGDFEFVPRYVTYNTYN